MISTKIVEIDPLNPKEDYLKEAARVLKAGGLVMIPTETVYGIAANASNQNTIERLYTIKKRPKDKSFSLHIDAKAKLEDFAQDIPTSAYKLIDKFWPGPLTLVLKSKNHGKIGIRMPKSEIALRIIARSGVPVVCPSANISGTPAPTDFAAAIQQLQGLVDFAIDAGSTDLKIESSVVDLTLEPWQMLREAAIKKTEIEAVLKKKIILFVCTGNSCRSVMAKGLLEEKLREQKRDDIEVLSAGIMMFTGLGASHETRVLLEKEGIDVSLHASQRATKEMIRKSDLILAMERLQQERVLEIAPEAKNRVFLLKEFAKIDDYNLDINDPIGKSEDFYRETFFIIKDAVEKISHLI